MFALTVSPYASLLQKPVARAPDASSRIEHRYNNEITSDLSRMFYFYNRLTLRLMGHLCRLRCPRHGEDIETAVFSFLLPGFNDRANPRAANLSSVDGYTCDV